MSDPCASNALSRRTFLRRAGQGGLAMVPWAAACARDERSVGGDDPGVVGTGSSAIDGVPLAAATPLTRPILRPWSDDIVRIDASMRELPIAYVSMALRQVFVDRAFRDRASWLLDAHISVSTWHWRIRLPGDSPTEPISPGDRLREFEELDIGAWDPSMVPSMDDIRIGRGAAVLRRIEFTCLPGTDAPDAARAAAVDVNRRQSGRENAPQKGDTWYRGGPWETLVAGGTAGRGRDDDATREDFRVVGTGLRFSERTCAGDGEVVQFATWASREALGNQLP